jgi:hypothetical protein
MIRIQGVMLGAYMGTGSYGPPTAPPDDPLTADLLAATLCARSVAFRNDYLAENPTPERMAETLIKLEREVLGREIRAPLGRRRAVIRIAPPLDAVNFLPGHKTTSSLDDCIESLVVRLHEMLQAGLDGIGREERSEEGPP